MIAGLLLTLIVYFPSLTNGITNWDDSAYVNNPYVRNLSLAGIVNTFSHYAFGNYHPLTLLSLGIDRLIGGDGSFIFHFTNLLFHLFNTFLVFLLVKRLTQNNLLAVFTFILFGVHTLHVESVAWVAERKDVLYSFFYLLSLAVYITYASGRKRICFGLSLLFFLLASLAKGQAVVLVAILPFIDYMKGRKWFSIKVLSEKIPFFLLSLIFGWVAIRAQESANVIHSEYFSLPERFAFASFGLTQYLIKSILPIGLSALYPYPPRLSTGSIPLFYWLFIITLPFYITGFYFLFKRSKIYAFGLGMFLLNLIPILQLIPVGGAIMADRYFYIPSVGLLLCVAFVLLEIRNTAIRYGLFILFTLVLSTLSFSRCMIWKDSIRLWDDVISKYDWAQIAYSNRGIAYGNIGQWNKAIDDYSRAIEINPKFAIVYSNRGAAYDKLGQWDKAVDDYSKAIRIDPNFALTYSNRGVAYEKLGQWDKAITDECNAIEMNPDSATAYYNRGVAYSNLGQWDKAIADYSRAIKINPKYKEAYNNRGAVYGDIGQWEMALADDSKAIIMDPDYAKAFFNRGNAYGRLGQWDKAITDYSSAIRLDPNYTMAYSNREVAYRKLRSEKR